MVILVLISNKSKQIQYSIYINLWKWDVEDIIFFESHLIDETESRSPCQIPYVFIKHYD